MLWIIHEIYRTRILVDCAGLHIVVGDRHDRRPLYEGVADVSSLDIAVCVVLAFIGVLMVFAMVQK